VLQVKIAELPLDSFRMLQALEWEDQYSSPSPPSNEHPLPLTKSSSAKSLSEKGKAGSIIMDNGRGDAREQRSCALLHLAPGLYAF
jgi:hypothetical protein